MYHHDVTLLNIMVISLLMGALWNLGLLEGTRWVDVYFWCHRASKRNVRRHNIVFVPFTMCELNDSMTKLCNDKTCMLRKCKNMMHKCISEMHAGIIFCSQGHSSKAKVNHAQFYIWLIEPSKIHYRLKLHQKFSSYGQFFVTVKGQGHVSPKSGHFQVAP